MKVSHGLSGILWCSSLGALSSLYSPAIASCSEPEPASQPSSVDQEQLKRLSLEDLGKVEVTTFSKQPTEVWDTPSAIYVITGDDIIRSGVTNIADALRLAPGVEVGRLSSTTWAVGIRGLQSNFSKSVLVLIDGRNVYTPLFAGVYWDVQDMPLEDIDRIEVIRGPGGTIWGPNAANGVINIITRHSSETQGVMATALAGTQDHTIDDLQYGGATISRKFSYRLLGRGFERGHEYHTDGINEDAWHEARLGFRGDLDSGHNAYFAAGDLYIGTSPHIVGTTPFYDQTSGGDINLRWEHTADTGSGFTLQGYFERTGRTGSALGETRNTIDIDFVHHFHLSSKQQFTYGGGLRWSPYHILSQNPEETLVPAILTDYIHTGFAQDQIQLGEKLSLTIGVKLQDNNYSGFDVQPSARLLWKTGPNQSLWLGATRAVTTPSDLERDFRLAGGTPTFILQVLGNPHFKSEDVIGYELGYRRLLGRKLYVDIASFWSEYARLQSFSAPAISTTGGVIYVTYQYQNQIGGFTSGFEVSPQLAIAPWWRINTSYSFLSSNFQAFGATSSISDSGSVNTYEKSNPKHTVIAESKIDLPAGFRFNQTYRFASSLPAQKVEAYQTMDLSLGHSLGRNLSCQVVGQNLFQPHHYEWGTGDPTQPNVGIYRAAYVKLTFFSRPSAAPSGPVSPRP
jgi:iron complex outermembrane recepter protein